MKKFFSLVLALVMALSLTTVAWGASVDEAALVDVATNGGTVTLDHNITLYDTLKIATGKTVTLNLGGYTLSIVSQDVHDTGKTGLPTILVEYGATLIIEGTGTVDNIRNRSAAVFNNGTVTLNGGTYTRSAEAGANGSTNANSYYTIVNHGVMTIGAGASVNNSGDYSTAITNGYSGKSTGTGKDWAGMTSIHVNGENAANPTLTINGGTFTGGKHTVNNDGSGELTINAGSFSGGYKTIVRNHEVATIKGGTFDGTGVAGSTVLNEYEDGISSAAVELTIIGGSFVGAVAESGDVDTSITGGTFSSDVSGYLPTDSKVVDNGDGTFSVVDKVYVAQVGSTKYETVAEALTAATAGDTIVLLAAAGEVEVGKAVTIDPNGFAVTVKAATGYQVLKNTAGEYVVTAAVTMGDKFDLYLADKNMNTMLKLETPSVAGLSFTEVKANTYKDGSGNVAYIVANNGEYYVKTSTPYTTSYAVTEAGETDVLYYVNVGSAGAGYYAYEASVTAFNKFSTYDKCGYVTDTPAATDVYFQTAAGVVYKAKASVEADATKNYLLDGEVVTAGDVQKVVDHEFMASGYKYDTKLKVNVPTSALCSKCLMTSTTIYKDGKVPAATKFYELYEGNKATDYSVVAEASAPSVGGTTTPSTGKVESAATFDAGIAMYVGMSVMAAAGSAVVIGKKKD